MQAEARAHLEKQLSAFPDGMPVVTLNILPGHPDHWLLTRCVSGQTPQLVQIEVQFLPTVLKSAYVAYLLITRCRQDSHIGHATSAGHT